MPIRLAERGSCLVRLCWEGQEQPLAQCVTWLFPIILYLYTGTANVRGEAYWGIQGHDEICFKYQSIFIFQQGQSDE